jgi:NADPH2:quinone reductase
MTQALKMMAADYGGPEHVRAYEIDVPDAGPGEVTIDVRAAGMNPTDFKGISGARGRDASKLPLSIGREVAGVIAAIGDGTEIASGGGAAGDPVVAYDVPGGYTTRMTVPARDVYAKPDNLDFPEAANLLLVGVTAADMLRVGPVEEGQTVVVHGASGAAGVSLLQQLRPLGVRAIGTASEHNFDLVRRFGGEPVAYGDGLEGRLRELAPDGYAVAFDCVGTDEAVDTSLAMVPKDRLVSIAAFARANEGFKLVAGANPDSVEFRNSIRGDVLDLAARGELVVPMGRTFPLRDAAEALAFLAEQHPGGKLALIP